ncbi:MAG: response regulator transcription factor [Cyanobacteria bacterium P01_A01_bin.40]
MINILLVDDQALLCEVLKTWLDVEPDIQVLGVAHDGQEAIAAVEQLQPDIVLMDIDMPQMDGLKATTIISQRFPKVKVIFLSGHDDDVYLGRSLRAGAKGYLLKNTTADELVQKIRSVYDNVNLLEITEQEGSLAPLQQQLEELIETYRLKFENIIEVHDSTLNNDYWESIEQKLEQGFRELEAKIDSNLGAKISELEYKNQSSWKSIRKELININSQFNQANRNLTTQFNQQINNLRQDLDSKLSSALDDWSRQRAALQEWAVQRDEMRPSIEDYETKNRQELMSVVNPIRTSYSDLNQQIRTIRNWLFASGLLALLALTVSGYVIMLQVKSGNSLIVPNQDAIN